MPWTIKDVPDHVKGLTPAQQAVWVKVANEELDENPNDEASAIKIANAAAEKAGKTKAEQNSRKGGTERRDAPMKSVGGKELPASAFAYVGDPKDPSTWHLPIHDEAHAQDALSRFNQAEIPDDEKATVARKIAAKAKSFGIDTTSFEKEYVRHWARVLEFRAALPKMERRFCDYELRRGDGGPTVHMEVPYNAESDGLGGFREVVKPGAFSKSANENDVVSLWNHDPNWVLGRSSNGTLAMRSTDKSFQGDVKLDPEDQMHNHFARRIERRDVQGTSFGFDKIRDSWGGVASTGVPLRALQEIRLHDLSPVTFPAYSDATAEKRSMVLELAAVRGGVDVAGLAAILAEAKEGHVPATHAEEVRTFIGRLTALLPPPDAPIVSDEDRVRRLDLSLRLAGVQ